MGNIVVKLVENNQSMKKLNKNSVKLGKRSDSADLHQGNIGSLRTFYHLLLVLILTLS